MVPTIVDAVRSYAGLRAPGHDAGCLPGGSGTLRVSLEHLDEADVPHDGLVISPSGKRAMYV
eukprot:CAMPEP_0117673946 /NCGR_PEP_ID=MMETSP0804-20121206/14762_1 /TAXON_ID=1074897 /ORGANISM="Tetraselmis astigmatica, Strain CCMP880" /LENGTH=61 /DNA_ID=CAMNT_0005482755 /DNA_START=480 /DNA_END=665 /DNA_ORIENTATION=-